MTKPARWGGTVIELWLPKDAPAGFPELASLQQAHDKEVADYNAQLARAIEPMGQGRLPLPLRATRQLPGARHEPGRRRRLGQSPRGATQGSANPHTGMASAIDGSTVLVCSTNVPAPTAVRYAFTVNPEGCNLYNKEGLPASPFRTDSW